MKEKNTLTPINRSQEVKVLQWNIHREDNYRTKTAQACKIGQAWASRPSWIQATRVLKQLHKGAVGSPQHSYQRQRRGKKDTDEQGKGGWEVKGEGLETDEAFRMGMQRVTEMASRISWPGEQRPLIFVMGACRRVKTDLIREGILKGGCEHQTDWLRLGGSSTYPWGALWQHGALGGSLRSNPGSVIYNLYNRGPVT